jgi:radical SAM superfamily enzyme YgiQ (UPF0313 family)
MVTPMRVLFISANREQINMLTLPMGLACVAAAARQSGHDVELVDLLTAADPSAAIEQAVRAADPEVIAVSVRNIDDQNMAAPVFLLDQAKEAVANCRRFSEAPVVLGGAGYSIFAQSVLEYLSADMGIQGEGEVAFPMVLERLRQAKGLEGIPGLVLPGAGLQQLPQYVRNLDEIAFPDPDLICVPASRREEVWLPFQTRRGCPMDCSYCSTSTIEGRMPRKHSVDASVSNLARWAEAGYTKVFFVDNTFNLPPSYALALCKRMVAAGLKLDWRCIVHPGSVTAELATAMAEAGCREISLGFESGCQSILKAMNKRFRPADVREASRLFAGCGIRCMGFLMLGGPGETRESVEESLAFAESLNLDALKLTVGIRIYPFTRLAKLAVAEGLVSPQDSLLLPRFYLVPELAEWLPQTVRARAKGRPNWIF